MKRGEIEESQNLPPIIKKCLDSLIQYGYIWDFKDCYVKRQIFSRSIITRVDVKGKYNIFKTHFGLSRSSGGQNYSVGFFYGDLKLFRLTKVLNLNILAKECISFTKILNKIRNRKIISIKRFIEDKKKFTIVSCKNNNHLIFVIDTFQVHGRQKFIREERTENLKDLINRIKLIYRL